MHSSRLSPRELARLRPRETTAPRSAALRDVSVGVAGVGALAVGAFAIGALAIGAFAIGRLSVNKARFRSLEIDDLTVRRLRILDTNAVRQLAATMPPALANNAKSRPLGHNK